MFLRLGPITVALFNLKGGVLLLLVSVGAVLTVEQRPTQLCLLPHKEHAKIENVHAFITLTQSSNSIEFSFTSQETEANRPTKKT